jgi:hypothetical protein
MAFLVLGANSVSGYTVKNSLRFNSGSSDYLNKTFGTATNRKIFTFSLWVKRSKLTADVGYLMSAGTNASTNIDEFYFKSTDLLGFSAYESSVTQFELVTTQVFRDVSAWYHVLVAYDSTQATSTNRIKMYINGSQVTAFGTATYPSLNFEPLFNSANAHTIARNLTSGSKYFDGYMSEYYFIDGQALTPSSFGETDTDTGIWIPKSYGGSYGTNGFYLKFANSASLGTDSSGNGNTFTVNNLTSVDQTTDTPTNNFCTWNPLWFSGTTVPNTSFTEGNLQVQTTTTAGANSEIQGTIGVNKGKWYYEFKMTSTGTGSGLAVGFANNNYTDSITYYSDTGKYYTESTSVTYGATWTTNDIIGVAFDCDNNTVIFYKNGTSQGTITSAFSNLSTDYYLPLMWDGSGSLYANGAVNFGNPPYSANSYTDGAGRGNFSYAVPSGYFALCTANLSLYG